MVVNVAINLALMHSLGHVGIALGTSISAWVNVAILAVVLHRRGHLRADARLKRRLPRTVLATVAMGIVLWVALAFTERTFGPVFGTPLLPAAHFALRSVVLALLIGLGGGVFALGAWLIGAAEINDLRNLRRRRN
jgi:putative peptidoglycan lipid II flippase